MLGVSALSVRTSCLVHDHDHVPTAAATLRTKRIPAKMYIVIKQTKTGRLSDPFLRFIYTSVTVLRTKEKKKREKKNGQVFRSFFPVYLHNCHGISLYMLCYSPVAQSQPTD